MKQKTVEKLEIENEEAIAEIIMKMGIKRLPLVPFRLTMHLRWRKPQSPCTRQPSKTMIVTDRGTDQSLIAFCQEPSLSPKRPQAKGIRLGCSPNPSRSL
jgi:hypothetical protein